MVGFLLGQPKLRDRSVDSLLAVGFNRSPYVGALDRCDAACGVGCMRWTVRTGMLPSSPTLSM
jgi:hypothetical protein